RQARQSWATPVEPPPVDDQMIAQVLNPDVLAREQQRVEGGVEREPLELALLAESCIVRRIVDALAVRTLAKLVQRAVAREQEHEPGGDGDRFKVSFDGRVSHDELFGDDAATIVDLRDLAMFV